jgi:rfaE bifunctional protein kinase chain/domain
VLASITDVDYVAIVDSDSAVVSIKKIKPNFYVKGPDYKSRRTFAHIPRKLNEEEEAVNSIGGKLIFTSDEIVFSSSSLINNYFDIYPPKTKEYLDTLKEKYTAEMIIEKLEVTKNTKILVIGDAIIDQYHYTLPLGRSSKEPIMVHHFISDESFAGGALATANHLASLSDSVTLLTILGKKHSFRNFITKKLKSIVKPVFFYQPNSDTIVKRRYLDAFTKQKQFQLTYMRDGFIDEKIEKAIIAHLKNEIAKFDLVVVNDFGHGLLTDKIIKTIISRANYLTLNVQANSANYGFNVVTKYPRADFVCIDEAEIRLATHDKYGDIKSLVKKIYRKMKCKDMLVTRGASGSLGYSDKDGYYETPALTERIVDRVGAGDALFAIASPCLFSGMERHLVAFIGNVAGALQVQVVGNKRPIELVDLTKFITRLLK